MPTLISISKAKSKKRKNPRGKLLSSIMSKLAGERGEAIAELYSKRKVTAFQEEMTQLVEEMVDEIRR